MYSMKNTIKALGLAGLLTLTSCTDSEPILTQTREWGPREKMFLLQCSRQNNSNQYGTIIALDHDGDGTIDETIDTPHTINGVIYLLRQPSSDIVHKVAPGIEPENHYFSGTKPEQMTEEYRTTISAACKLIPQR